jgi:predicted nucleic acid-binding protein
LAGKAIPTGVSNWLARDTSKASLVARCWRNWRKSCQSKLSFTAEQSVETLADLLTFLRVVAITGQLKAVPADPDDDKVLECAAKGGATYIVTGDRRHLLPLGSFQGIPIVTAAEFLKVATKP